jgi:hypothetical protein
MHRAASMVITFVISAVLVSPAALVVDNCDNVPFMTREDACLRLFSKEVCQDTLRGAAEMSEVAVYAYMAMLRALARYEDTMDQMLMAGNVTVGLKQELHGCKEKYARASSLMLSSGSQTSEVSSCDMESVVQECHDAQSAVASCSDGVWLYLMEAPDLLHMVSEDDTQL